MTGEQTRPRVEGERERQILAATIDALAELGYDRLTMDAVARRAHASKATLYRRWQGKATLVGEALLTQDPLVAPDTGSLRGDLVAAYCGLGGLADPRNVAAIGAVITALGRDVEFAEEFRARFIAPRLATASTILERAVARGEIPADRPVDLLALALPGTVLYGLFVLGQVPDADLVTRVIDEVVLPAVGVAVPTLTGQVPA